MTTIPLQKIVDAGTAPSFAAATASDRAAVGNGLNTFLHYKNSGGSASVVTVAGVGDTDYGVAEPNNVVTVAATTGEALVPLHHDQDQGDGLGALVTATNVTGLTVALVQR